MNQPASLITDNQRVIDQMALENLNGARINKVNRDKKLVLHYLRKKFPHVSNLDSSVIDGMAKNEFNRVLKRAKITSFSILGLVLIPLFCLFLFVGPISTKVIVFILWEFLVASVFRGWYMSIRNIDDYYHGY